MTIGKIIPPREMALLMLVFFSSSMATRTETKGGKAPASLSICYNIDIPPARFESFNYAEKPVEVSPPLLGLIAAIRQRHSANGLVSCVSVKSLDIVPVMP